MPTYEYECQACGHQFDVLRSYDKDMAEECPKCGELIHQPHISGGCGVHFKGSGFYETDYKHRT